MNSRLPAKEKRQQQKMEERTKRIRLKEESGSEVYVLAETGLFGSATPVVESKGCVRKERAAFAPFLFFTRISPR